MNKVITLKELSAIVDILDFDEGEPRWLIERRTRETLVAAGHTIESEPILPDMPGEWSVGKPTGKYDLIAINNDIPSGVSDYTTIGYGVNDKYAQFLAGGKKFVELVVADYRLAGINSAMATDEARAVVDQLEKMGFDVDEFRK